MQIGSTTGAGNLTWPAATQTTTSDKVTTGASAAGLFDSVNTDKSTTVEDDSADGTEDRFLKLLVAQMRNQDPLNPMDNAQVTTQLAQISTVRGVEGLNKTMSSFVNQTTAVSAVGMLGKQVLVSDDTFNYTPPSSGKTRVGFELGEAASAARLDVVDAKGNVVFSKSMTNLAKGMQTVEWDGKTAAGTTVPAGALSIQVVAVGSDGKTTLDAEPLVPARVTGVSQTSDGVRLEIEGGGSVPVTDVKSIT